MKQALFLVLALQVVCYGADQPTDLKNAAQELPTRWGDRWYSIVKGGVNIGWMQLKVEKQGERLVLKDQFFAKPDRDHEMTIASSLTAEPNEFLSPVALDLDFRSPGGSGKTQIQPAKDGVSVTYNGQKMGNDAKLPSSLVTDFALLRLVTMLPRSGSIDLVLFDTIQHSKPRPLEGRLLKFDADEEIEIAGKKLKTRRYVLKASNTQDQLFWVDGESRLVKFTLAGFDVVLSDQKSANQIDNSKLREAPVVHKNPPTPSEAPPFKGLPVFPGAEGFGTRTPAGRGGKLIEVTTLADGGAGSLREALDTKGPRIIVFRTGGTIELKSELFIKEPFVTIAGQTAPGGGIQLKDYGVTVATHDVLMQHLRVRPGNEGKSVKADDNDAICVMGADDNKDGAFNVVLDHISAGWSEDEALSVVLGAHDVTISWSIVSEALSKSRHAKGKHSAGVLIGMASDRVSLHHCLLAHDGFRNPLVSKGGTHDVVNNLIYNWEDTAGEVYDPDGNTFLNFVGNTYIAGPNSQPSTVEMWVHEQTNIGTPNPRLYVKDNFGPHRTNAAADDWSLVCFSVSKLASKTFQVATPFKTWPITTLSAAEATEKVLAGAGATQPSRDPVDTRVVTTVKEKSGKLLDSPKEVGGHPVLDPGAAPKDSDHDGMPDDWETAHGLDPANPADGNTRPDKDGYTNVEVYLHSLLK